jgi:hypothetical protein
MMLFGQNTHLELQRLVFSIEIDGMADAAMCVGRRRPKAYRVENRMAFLTHTSLSLQYPRGVFIGSPY